MKLVFGGFESFFLHFTNSTLSTMNPSDFHLFCGMAPAARKGTMAVGFPAA